MSDVSVNTVRPATTTRVNFQGLQVPTYLGDPIITLSTMNAINVNTADSLNAFGATTVEGQLQEIASGFKLVTGDTTSVNAEQLIRAFYRAVCPIGKVIMSYQPISTASPPHGTLPLDGTLYNRASYPQLWNWVVAQGNLIVTEAAWMADKPLVGKFSDGDGFDTFRVPDLRGAFIRVHGGSNLIYSGSPQGLGIDSGRELASKQLDEFKAHTHTLPTDGNGTLDEQTVTVSPESDESLAGTFTGSTGGTETRPINVALGFFIYY